MPWSAGVEQRQSAECEFVLIIVCSERLRESSPVNPDSDSGSLTYTFID